MKKGSTKVNGIMTEKQVCFICKQPFGLGMTTRIMPNGKIVNVCGFVCQKKKLTQFGFGRPIKKPKDIKLSNAKPTVKDLDELCRETIRLRDNNTCRRCGRSKGQGWRIEWAHFYSRSNKAIRWDMDNSCMLCFNCHYEFGHKHPKEFAEFWKDLIGEKNFDSLTLRSNGKVGDYRLIKLYLNQKKLAYSNKCATI